MGGNSSWGTGGTYQRDCVPSTGSASGAFPRYHSSVRRTVPQALGSVLVLGSLVVFYETVVCLERRDYVAAILLMFMGFAVIRAGVELLRFAFSDT